MIDHVALNQHTALSSSDQKETQQWALSDIRAIAFRSLSNTSCYTILTIADLLKPYYQKKGLSYLFFIVCDKFKNIWNASARDKARNLLKNLVAAGYSRYGSKSGNDKTFHVFIKRQKARKQITATVSQALERLEAQIKRARVNPSPLVELRAYPLVSLYHLPKNGNDTLPYHVRMLLYRLASSERVNDFDRPLIDVESDIDLMLQLDFDAATEIHNLLAQRTNELHLLHEHQTDTTNKPSLKAQKAKMRAKDEIDARLDRYANSGAFWLALLCGYFKRAKQEGDLLLAHPFRLKAEGDNEKLKKSKEWWRGLKVSSRKEILRETLLHFHELVKRGASTHSLSKQFSEAIYLPQDQTEKNRKALDFLILHASLIV